MCGFSSTSSPSGTGTSVQLRRQEGPFRPPRSNQHAPFLVEPNPPVSAPKHYFLFSSSSSSHPPLSLLPNTPVHRLFLLLSKSTQNLPDTCHSLQLGKPASRVHAASHDTSPLKYMPTLPGRKHRPKWRSLGAERPLSPNLMTCS